MQSVRKRSGLSALATALAASILVAMPVLAYQEEGGTKNCGAFIGYTHARFNWDGWTRGPGDPFIIFWDYPSNSGWHVQEDNGSYSGAWLGRGDPTLDLGGTYAGCRNYG